jgi:hypothetical protein
MTGSNSTMDYGSIRQAFFGWAEFYRMGQPRKQPFGCPTRLQRPLTQKKNGQLQPAKKKSTPSKKSTSRLFS